MPRRILQILRRGEGHREILRSGIRKLGIEVQILIQPQACEFRDVHGAFKPIVFVLDDAVL